MINARSPAQREQRGEEQKVANKRKIQSWLHCVAFNGGLLESQLYLMLFLFLFKEDESVRNTACWITAARINSTRLNATMLAHSWVNRLSINLITKIHLLLAFFFSVLVLRSAHTSSTFLALFLHFFGAFFCSWCDVAYTVASLSPDHNLNYCS